MYFIIFMQIRYKYGILYGEVTNIRSSNQLSL
eukprot:COSAG02_NODE_29739_length_564_cov_0.707527_1_plen_31_part_10